MVSFEVGRPLYVALIQAGICPINTESVLNHMSWMDRKKCMCSSIWAAASASLLCSVICVCRTL